VSLVLLSDFTHVITVDQRKILFRKKGLNCDNEVICVLSILSGGSIGMILSVVLYTNYKHECN